MSVMKLDGDTSGSLGSRAVNPVAPPQLVKDIHFGSRRKRSMSAASNVVASTDTHSSSSPPRMARADQVRLTRSLLSYSKAGDDLIAGGFGLVLIFFAVGIIVVALMALFMSWSAPKGKERKLREKLAENVEYEPLSTEELRQDAGSEGRVRSPPNPQMKPQETASREELPFGRSPVSSQPNSEERIRNLDNLRDVSHRRSASGASTPQGNRAFPSIPRSASGTSTPQGNRAFPSIARSASGASTPQGSVGRRSSKGSTVSIPIAKGAPTPLSSASVSVSKLVLKLPKNIKDEPDVNIKVDCSDPRYLFVVRIIRNADQKGISISSSDASTSSSTFHGSLTVTGAGTMLIRGKHGGAYGYLESSFNFGHRFSYRLTFGRKEVAILRGRGPGSAGHVIMVSSENGSQMAESYMDMLVPVPVPVDQTTENESLEISVEQGMDTSLVILCYLGVMLFA